MKQKEAFAWGVKNVHFIWHGTNADPEVSYRGHVVNYYAVENTLWEDYKDECKELGKTPDDKDPEDFHNYCQRHADTVKELIMSL